MGESVLRGLELEVMKWVSENHPISVRETAERFGEERGLARTTVLTIMERLRKKGYLDRQLDEGIFVYSPIIESGKLMKGIVSDFVERTLGGSLSPFVAYLSDAKNLSSGEIAELKALVKELESEDKP